MCKAFTENNNELWYFEVSRPKAQYLLYYVLAVIKAINKARSTNK